jgi:hypothetical protein
MRVTPTQAKVLILISNTAGGYDASYMASVTEESLLRKGLIEKCARLYFGPRTLRYRLTETGKQWVKKQHERFPFTS